MGTEGLIISGAGDLTSPLAVAALRALSQHLLVYCQAIKDPRGQKGKESFFHLLQREKLPRCSMIFDKKQFY